MCQKLGQKVSFDCFFLDKVDSPEYSGKTDA
jgi:hypothetical protein